MKKIIIAGLLFSVVSLSSVAGDLSADGRKWIFSGHRSPLEVIRQAIAGAVPAAPTAIVAPARPAKEWTIMIYMNGKNNLSPYVIKDMNEMEVFGPSPNINILTEAGRTGNNSPASPGPNYDDYNPVAPHPGWPSPQWPSLPPVMSRTPVWTTPSTNWLGVRRYEIGKDTDTYEINSRVVETLGKTDMGDWNHLTDFVTWAKNLYPARRYMLVVWNHGDGWKTKSSGLESILKGISYDYETGNGITTVQLGMALGKAGGVDIYASDACLMQMSEVIYELRGAAPIIVGSEETEPGDGWSYEYFLERVHRYQAALTPETMAGAAVEGYTSYYADKGKGTTQSAVYTRELGGFRALVDQWSDLAISTGDKNMLSLAAAETKWYRGADARDFTGFLSLVAARTTAPELKAKSKEVISFISDRVVFINATSGEAYKTSTGLSIYLPGYGYDANYSKLAWSADGKWNEFVQWLRK